MTRIPVATYRIQFNPRFNFAEAGKIVSYLAELDISDIYASPIFQARKGSRHGYDVVDHNRINPELGGDTGFEELAGALKGSGLGWLQDFVPNHMAFDRENTPLMDILENGENSEYFNFFDIEWNHPYENLKGRLLAPFLGKFYAECLENEEIRLAYDQSGLSIFYYDFRFPLKLSSYGTVFSAGIEMLEQKLGANNSDLVKFIGMLHFLKTASFQKQVSQPYDRVKHSKAMLRSLYDENPEIKKFMDQCVDRFNGKKGDARSFNNLDDLLFEQAFRLSFWKTAAEEINYRRFFSINDLISIRVEEEAVFNYVHNLIFQLIKEGKISGLRIDHIDGLYNPSDYLRKLREKIGETYLVVEKILDFKEQLPDFWPVEGTTGYDFLNYLNGIFCKKENEKEFSRIYYKFTGWPVSYEELVGDKKRLIIGKHMAGNIDNLALLIKQISSRDRYGRDITLFGLRRALVEVMAVFPVYRTYINNEMFTAADKFYIKEAIEKAKLKIPGLIYELNFIEKFLSLDFGDNSGDEERKRLLDFVLKFQQFTAPLMAKGFEDTVLYLYNKLISLNEVGGNPSRFGVALEEFHDFNRRKISVLPHSLSATATHDTKRGEDVRARINVLSEIPQEWKDNLKKWSKINKKNKKKLKGRYAPDENDEYFLYQTLIGVFPFAAEEYPTLVNRIKDYMIKAVREAKVHTAWIKPDAEYENGCLVFIDKILKPDDPDGFLSQFIPFQKKVAFWGIFNSLSQSLIKITAPGVPDLYQGTEFWDFNLVDPDNRRGVDFSRRESALKTIKEKEQQNILDLIAELLAAKEDGRIKLFLLYRALKTRKEKIDVFQKGTYLPVQVEGKYKDRLIAFARNWQNFWALTIAPRFLSVMVKEDEYPLGKNIWQDTRLVLPSGCPCVWRESISGQPLNGGNNLMLGDILRHFPAALLIGDNK